jgi:hypothetical protein
MSADKDRAIRRQKQKRAKHRSKNGQQKQPAALQPASSESSTPQKAE